MNDEVEVMLERAAAIAYERGYAERQQSELLTMAEAAAERHFRAASLNSKIGAVIFEGSQPKDVEAGLLDHGEAAVAAQDDAWLEYMAVVSALEPDRRAEHTKAMIDRYGSRFLTGNA